MSDFHWVTVIVAVSILLVLAVGSVWVLRSKSAERTRIVSLSPAERAALDALSEAKTAHRNALREYKQRVSVAEKEHRRESNLVASELKRAQQQLKEAEAIGRKLVQRYRGRDGSAELFQHQIVIKDQTFALGPDVNATVDSSGNLARTKRSTLTRMAAGGALLGKPGILAGGMLQKKKVHDDRELYLMLEGQSFAALIACNPDQGAVVRKFATNVNNAGRNVDAANTAHEEAVQQAATNLSQVRTSTDGAIPVIDMKLARVKAENAHLRDTEVKLASLTQPPTNEREHPHQRASPPGSSRLKDNLPDGQEDPLP